VDEGNWSCLKKSWHEAAGLGPGPRGSQDEKGLQNQVLGEHFPAILPIF